jgi:O-antigen/teichoic acid export membrane protein
MTRSWIVKNFLNAAIIKATSQLAGFLTTVVLARNLTISEYSDLSYFLSVVFILSLPIYSGSQVVITQNISKFNLNRDYYLSLEYIKFLFQICCRLFFIVIAFYLLFNYFLGEKKFSFIILAPLAAIGMAAPPIISAFLRGVDKFIISIIVEPFLRAITMLLFVSVVFYFGLHLSGSIIFYYSFGLLVSLILSIFLAKASFLTFLKSDNNGLSLAQKDKKYFNDQWILVTLYGFFISASGHVEILILDVMDFANEIGEFRNFLVMSGITLFPMIIINQMLQNRTVKFFYNNKHSELRKILLEGNKVSIVFAFFLGFIFWTYGKEIIGFVFGDRYSNNLSAFYILVMVQIVNVFFGSSGMVMTMTGNHAQAVKILTISFTIQITLAPILIAYYGSIGAAYSMLFGMIVWKLLMWLWVRQKLSINTSLFLYYFERSILKK